MQRRARQSAFEDWVEVLARLPWQVRVALAAVSWFGFHQLAEIEPPAARNVSEMGGATGVMLFKAAGMFLQYLVPFALLLAALMSWCGKRRRAKLLAETEKRADTAPLQQLTWREFEQLVGAHFERLGYMVSFTPDGADGGVDVIARKGSEIFLVQCKQWRATQVGVSVVRELLGMMAAFGATGAFVVSTGAFSNDAKALGDGRNIELIDANNLLNSAPPNQIPSASLPAQSLRQSAPGCPKCASVMVRRVARQGANKGQAFYGCGTYPQCRGTLPAN